MEIIFNRAALKEAAKQSLQNRYWLSLAVALLTGTAGIGGHFTFSSNFGDNSSGIFSSRLQGSSYYALIMGIMLTLGIVFLALTVYSIIKLYWVGGPLSVGGKRYFIGLTKGEGRFYDIGYAFLKHTPDSYKNVRQTMFCTVIFTYLWYLLPAVPTTIGAIGLLCFGEKTAVIFLPIMLLSLPLLVLSVIKVMDYEFIPYLLAEHPGMQRRDVFAASAALIRGHKGDIFVLGLSFIGWILLGMLCCGIGVVFVLPYMEATYAHAYAVLCRMFEQNRFAAASAMPYTNAQAPAQDPQSTAPEYAGEMPDAPLQTMTDPSDQPTQPNRSNDQAVQSDLSNDQPEQSDQSSDRGEE